LDTFLIVCPYWISDFKTKMIQRSEQKWWSEQGKPVAVLGGGISGLAACKLLNQRGLDTQLFDEKTRVFNESDARDCSFIVRSPGFCPSHEWIRIAVDSKKTILSEVDLGFSLTKPLEIVAITGTNGKTSLTSILNHVANNLNLPSLALGNIGTPISDAVSNNLVEDKIVFHETSSFQALTSNYFKPNSLLWTNFSSDHLDYHRSEVEYFLAKLKIANQCLCPSQVFLGKSVIESARKFGLILNPSFRRVDPLIVDGNDLNLPAFFMTKPQLENLAFALAWFQEKGVSKTQFFDHLDGYIPPKYRLSKTSVVNQVSFWNDSKSTNLSSTLAAVKSLDKKIIWIGGGRSKGQKLEEFSRTLYPHIHKAFLIGETANELSELLRSKDVEAVVCQNLEEAIYRAFKHANSPSDILFSPGFASFDMFKDYSQRGKSFETIVFDLKTALQKTTKIEVNFL